ncbi:unnamed protein product [Ranitomeya imitator]|uniref:Uncharacterized protein n=1 Tax=Ranitomeya imitator TaxID=111125 RepID=A0ABN9M0Q0_9NEOB|nr:unnamed protein product [Ranitomeya imitator]
MENTKATLPGWRAAQLRKHKPVTSPASAFPTWPLCSQSLQECPELPGTGTAEVPPTILRQNSVLPLKKLSRPFQSIIHCQAYLQRTSSAKAYEA